MAKRVYFYFPREQDMRKALNLLADAYAAKGMAVTTTSFASEGTGECYMPIFFPERHEEDLQAFRDILADNHLLHGEYVTPSKDWSHPLVTGLDDGT